ncbi:MAG TPA: CopD family protein [Gammaproteobacteria bacterium]|nr:CopD family protein [Gammaproteobacteria bacterium]
MSLLPAFAITLHLFAAIVWVGGMFFAYLAARPVLAELDTKLRARLWVGIFRRFFPWVWAAIVVLLVSGFYMASSDFDGISHAPLFVQMMMGLGILMMLIFGHVFFAPYKRLKQAVATGDDALAKKSMGMIRMLIALNLSLGLVVVAVAMLGTYLSSD